DDVFKKVDVLSGGEKNRLALARLTLDPGNFLLLDEPTNHLDLPTREALEDALASFAGTLLFVSHDRYFINKVATRVAAFRDGRILRERVGALEKRIVPLETRLKEIEGAMASPGTYKEPGLARRLGEEKKAIEIDLAHLYVDWDEATSGLQREERGGPPAAG